MTLAMTLGLKVGLRRTLWMMLGEVFGVALVAVSAVMGAADRRPVSDLFRLQDVLVGYSAVT